MSGNKSNRPQNNPARDPHKKGGEKESANRQVYIESGTRIDFVQDLKNQYEAAQRDSKDHNGKLLLWTKVGAALVFGYALITGFQWWDLRQNFKRDERAWVGPKEVIPQGDKQLTVVIMNAGKTPALAMTSFARPVQWCCDPDVMPATPEESPRATIDRTKTILLPGALHYLNVALMDMPTSVSPEDKARMIQEVRGIIHYNDVFDKPHWIRFCFAAIGAPDATSLRADPFQNSDQNTPKMPTYHYHSCTHGNDTDDHPEPTPAGIKEIPLE